MAEKSQYLTKKIEEAHSNEESQKIGDAIKAYEEIIRYHL
jgi:26S proteasome regulatory subunit N6